MNIKLSKAYDLLKRFNDLSNNKVLDRDLISDEISSSTQRINEDTQDFNEKTIEIKKYFDSNNLKEARNGISKLLITAMNIETELSNFTDQLRLLIKESDLFKDFDE